MPEIVFQEEGHIYTVDGKSIPSVTTILKACGLIDTTWFTEGATTRGTYVHQATELLDRDDLDESSLDPVLTPYVDAYRRFKQETGFVIDDIEKRVHNATYGYAGTLDRTGTFIGDKTKSIIDIKTGQPAKWHGVQLAAYALCFGSEVLNRYGLYLSNTGSYKLERFKDRQDANIWLACLTLYKWREKNGTISSNI